ncbi:MAG TPA: DNA/RNA non-specific endonuclease [Saprospiraceae bacterium]|nr:DNA/RNA non-specific endonuclease [Saprospiraceae bacterium]HRV85302.1 DNA/RNA non-specific endonuclease [Saprospiraceae bacterium]
MAKLRSNHRRAPASSVSRLMLLVILAATGLALGYQQFGHLLGSLENPKEVESEPIAERFYLPEADFPLEIVHHKRFSLGYLETEEQAAWVAYRLTVQELNLPKLPRYDYFDPDYSVSSGSSFHRDYTGSGYTRGHLVPAADMSFDSAALRETFLMSNISPQLKAFNNGVWRELEEQTRDWVRRNKELYIVSGPIFNPAHERIGQNRVGVPEAFYKVLLDVKDPEWKGIGFIIPNALSELPLSDYACTIDSVEHITHLDFFSHLLKDDQEEGLESSIDMNLWPMHPHRYEWRVNEWNHR